MSLHHNQLCQRTFQVSLADSDSGQSSHPDLHRGMKARICRQPRKQPALPGGAASVKRAYMAAHRVGQLLIS